MLICQSASVGGGVLDLWPALVSAESLAKRSLCAGGFEGCGKEETYVQVLQSLSCPGACAWWPCRFTARGPKGMRAQEASC